MRTQRSFRPGLDRALEGRIAPSIFAVPTVHASMVPVMIRLENPDPRVTFANVAPETVKAGAKLLTATRIPVFTVGGAVSGLISFARTPAPRTVTTVASGLTSVGSTLNTVTTAPATGSTLTTTGAVTPGSLFGLGFGNGGTTGLFGVNGQNTGVSSLGGVNSIATLTTSLGFMM
jgi:hypothetical protein